jgi:hypothetical protein
MISFIPDAVGLKESGLRSGYRLLLFFVSVLLLFEPLETDPAFSGSGPGPPVGAILELLTVCPEPVMPSSPFALLALAVSERPQPLKRTANASETIKAKVRRIEKSLLCRER